MTGNESTGDLELQPLAERIESTTAVKKSSVDSIKVSISVELGRTKMTIKDLLEIKHGQTIPLNRMIGEKMDMLANGKLIARGEVVAVDKDRFGIRLTEFLNYDPPEDAEDEDKVAQPSHAAERN